MSMRLTLAYSDEKDQQIFHLYEEAGDSTGGVWLELEDPDMELTVSSSGKTKVKVYLQRKTNNKIVQVGERYRADFWEPDE